MKILVIGNHPKVKGGITTVMNSFKTYSAVSDQANIKFLYTYRYDNVLFNILYFMFSIYKLFIKICFFNPDIIHIHMSFKGSFYRKNFIVKIVRFFKKKVIIHLHGSEFEKWFLQLNTKRQSEVIKFCNNVDSFIVLGEYWKKFINKISNNDNIYILNNAVSIPNYTVKLSEEFNILYLGVLIKRKGVQDLIDAVDLLDKKILDKNNVKFLITGSGLEYSNLFERVKMLNLDKYIEFLGWVNNDDKKTLLINSQLLVLPSYNEGLPMAILEAMSYGMPIISTNVGDIPQAVTHNENGFLFKPGSKMELSMFMHNIITDVDKWLKMSKSSKKIAVKKFDIDTYFNDLYNIYLTILKDKGDKNEN